jgi:hypothetical protein
MSNEQINIGGKLVQYDKSGVGHCWVDSNDTNCPAHIRDEIACEIIDGGNESCDDYVAENGQHYRW